MPLTEREKMVLDALRDWESNLYSYEPNDFELVYDRYLERSFSLLPDQVQERFFSLFDSWLFHLHSLIQGSQLQMDAKERILAAGRVFRPEIETIDDKLSNKIIKTVKLKDNSFWQKVKRTFL